MPVDFDESDIDGVVDEVNQNQAIVRHVPQQPAETIEVEEQMSEVEARLEVAQYYRLLLNNSLFEDPPNPDVADQVDAEVRAFIKNRMSVLMGMSQPEKPQARIFTDAEVQALRTLAQPEVVEALKAVAAKLLKKPAILDAKPLPKEKKADEPAKEPTLRKVRQNPAPRVQAAPAPEAPPRRSKPQERKTRIVETPDGREVKQDITPPAKPTGPIQPIPTGRTREQIEANAAQAAAYHARFALKALERNLRKPPEEE